MELFKNFALGGLFQSGKRMSPPWGSFRRFTNAYKDPTGTLLPYCRGGPVDNSPTIPAGSGATGFVFTGPIATQTYRKGILQLLAGAVGADRVGLFSYLGQDGNLLPIMQPFSMDIGENVVDITKHMAHLPSGNLSSCTVARKAFISSCVNTTDFDSTKEVGGFTPEETYLLTFDGLRVRGAGLPTPWTFADNTGVLAAHYVRGVYFTIGMDGEPIFSQYMQLQLAGATKNFYPSGYSAYPATPRGDQAGNAGVIPTYRRPEDHLFEKKFISGFGFDVAGSNTRYFDKRFVEFAPTSVCTVAGGEISLTMCTYPTSVIEGDWIMFDYGPMATINADLYMFKIKTLGATTVFEKNFKYLSRDSVTWLDGNFDTEWTSWGVLDVDIQLQFKGIMFQGGIFTNLFMIVAYSTTASSGYVVNSIQPIAWDSAHAGTSTVFSGVRAFKVPWAGVVSSLMADWYDATVTKTTFPPLKGITNYRELLVGHDSNAIYFQDINLGGSTEMVGGLSNLVPYGSEFGDIVAVCGCEDFLLVSRERKNYIITGDIAGSSFSISECDSPVGGAYNSKAATNGWAGAIIFMNKAGIFAVNSSGSIKDISEDIKGLFFSTNRDHNLFDKTVFRTQTQNRSATFDGGIFKFILEESRGFVVLLTAWAQDYNGLSVSGSNMLVYNVKDSKWYEFQGWGSSSIEASGGKIISLSDDRATEDTVMRGDERQLLVTQWLTVDAPSLEKQICQVKVFGEMIESVLGVRGMTVGQQNDWADFDETVRTNWNTEVSYVAKTTDIYYHKQRFDSSKPLTTSVILESVPQGGFALEGMEIEGVIIQSEVRK